MRRGRGLGLGLGSERAEVVARWFGVEGSAPLRVAGKRGMGEGVELCGGRIVLLTGASGAGKSTLLRSLCRRYRRSGLWIDLGEVRLGGKVVIDVMAEAMGGGGTEGEILGALEALSRVGLGEVWTYLKRPGQLSEGQRWRLRLAVGLAWAKVTPGLCVLAADEFAAPLDRVTALVVSRALRKAVSARPNLCAVVATPRDDLLAALDPDVVVECDFGLFKLHERR